MKWNKSKIISSVAIWDVTQRFFLNGNITIKKRFYDSMQHISVGCLQDFVSYHEI